MGPIPRTYSVETSRYNGRCKFEIEEARNETKADSEISERTQEAHRCTFDLVLRMYSMSRRQGNIFSQYARSCRVLVADSSDIFV